MHSLWVQLCEKKHLDMDVAEILIGRHYWCNSEWAAGDRNNDMDPG